MGETQGPQGMDVRPERVGKGLFSHDKKFELSAGSKGASE